MFGKGDLDRMRQLFADRFEPDGGDVLYRANDRAAPIRISVKERDRYIANFRLWMGRLFWGYVVAFLLVIGLIVEISVESGTRFDTMKLPLYAAIATITAIYATSWHRAWTAPTRALRDRAPVGFAPTPAEVRARRLDRLSYSQLAGGVLAIAAVLFGVSRQNDILHGRGRLWLLIGAAVLVLAAVQAVRKWRHEAGKARGAGA